MLIYNANKDNQGNWDFDLQLTNVEVDYLVNTAVQQLLTAGVLVLQEQEEEQKVDLPTANVVLN